MTGRASTGAEAPSKRAQIFRRPRIRPRGDRKMSLADRFDNEVGPAFTHSFDPESARRQLRVSITLVGAMCLAAFVLGLLSPIGGENVANQTKIAPDWTFSA